MKFFKTILLSATLCLGGLTHVSAPALADNPHCTIPNGCNLSSVNAGSGISVDNTDPSNPIISIQGGLVPIIGQNGYEVINPGPLSVNGSFQQWFVPLGTIIGHINVTCESYN